MVRKNSTGMSRRHREAMRQEMIQAGLLPRDGQLQLEKGNSLMFIKHMIKEKTQEHFGSEQELQEFIKKNTHLKLNQRYGFHTERINAEFYEHGYAEVYRNNAGYLVPTRWLDEDEVATAKKEGRIVD